MVILIEEKKEKEKEEGISVKKTKKKKKIKASNNLVVRNLLHKKIISVFQNLQLLISTIPFSLSSIRLNM